MLSVLQDPACQAAFDLLRSKGLTAQDFEAATLIPYCVICQHLVRAGHFFKSGLNYYCDGDCARKYLELYTVSKSKIL